MQRTQTTVTTRNLPGEQHVLLYLLETFPHLIRMGYILNQLGVGKGDPELPHDAVGPYNRFEWEVMMHLARKYESVDKRFTHQVVWPGVLLHRN